MPKVHFTPILRETRAVRAHELSELTQKGWVLIQTVPEDILENRCGVVRCDLHRPYNYNEPCDYVPKDGAPTKLTITLFVVALPEDVAEDQKQRRIEELEEKAASQAEYAAERNAQCESLEKEAGKLKKELKDKEKLASTQHEALKSCAASRDKLEEDIGKIREEFGAAAVRKALGE